MNSAPQARVAERFFPSHAPTYLPSKCKRFAISPFLGYTSDRMWIAGLIMTMAAGMLLAGVEAAEKPLRIVTTFLPGYCVAANLAGDLAHVENLLPGTVSLHDYQLTPADLRKIASADLIVVNGLGMEAFLDKAIANTGPETAAKIVRLSNGMEGELIRDNGVFNPHIWLNPRLTMQGVTNVLKALQARDAGHTEQYEKNAGSYLERLRALDASIEKTLEPVRAVAFVTYHNAFPYFVRRYGLTLAGVVERVPEVAPSPKEMSQLMETIRERKAHAIFTEPAEGTRLARQIASDNNMKVGELDPLETGQLEPRGYEEGLRRNAQTLRKTLGAWGTAPR
jgi:zinc transport system substrate-binding protein